MNPPEDLVCAVCGEAAETAAHLADCFACGRWYHLNPYSNRPGKDCGDAILGSVEGVETFCRDCLEAQQRLQRTQLGSGGHAQDMARSMFGTAFQLPPNASAAGDAPSEERRRFRRVEDE